MNIIEMKNKKLYKIGDLSKKLKLTQRTIRYYDQFGLLPHVKRSQKGTRLFDNTDIKIIEKIRTLQKTKFLSLKNIKESLFNNKNNSLQNMIVITDQFQGLETLKNTLLPIQILPVKIKSNQKTLSETDNVWSESIEKKEIKLEFPDSELIKKTFLKIQNKNIDIIYWIYSSNLSKNWEKTILNTIKKEKKINIIPIDTKCLYGAAGLLSEIIAEKIIQHENADSINYLIEKQLPLIHQIGFTNHFQHFKNTMINNKKTYEKLFKKILNLKYSFTIKNTTGELELQTANKTTKKALEEISLLLSEEIKIRGNYCNRILISYNQLEKEAKEITEKIKLMCPITAVHTQKASIQESNDLGPETILITLL